jgi:hypothetical protein
MASKRWIKRVLGVLISLGIANFAYAASQDARPAPIELSVQEQSRILNSAVQIKVSVLNGSESQPHGFQSPEEVLQVRKIYGYTECRGLGTVIDINGENYLVTHNHWGDCLSNADLLELSDAWGNLLLSLSGAEWNSLHIYQDAGTLILKAPQGLRTVPASLGDGRQVAAGDKVYIVHQNPQTPAQLEIIAADVASLGGDFGPLSWTMHVPGSIIVHGDSGGGIWAHGELVGNTWATGTTFNWQVWTWTSLATATTSSHTAYAASFPAHIVPSLAESEASEPGVTNLGSQHGIVVGP